MGHHAQYRKRGTHADSTPYALLPPQPGDWDADWNGTNLRGKIIAVYPGGVGAAATQWRAIGDEWGLGSPLVTRLAFFAVGDPTVPGQYEVRIAWNTFPIPGHRVSEYSAPKTVTVT